MGNNPTEEEKIISGLRTNLLLALRYARGENANSIWVDRLIRNGLDELSKLEEIIK